MGLVGQNQQTAFSDPQNGQSPIDADVVRTNDNAIRTKLNAHDADATIHVQSGTLASRPAAGTAGAMYLDDNGRLYRDSGSVWSEVPYARLDAAGVNAFDNNVTIGGTLGVTGTTTLGVVNVSGAAAFSGGVTVPSGDLDVTGTVTATTFSGSGASLTALPAAELTGTLPAISGANLTSLNASNISSGTLNAARLPTVIGGVTINGSTVNAPGSVIGLTFSGNSASASTSLIQFGDNYCDFVYSNPAPDLVSVGCPIPSAQVRWVKVTYDDAASNTTGYIPVIVHP